MIKNLTDAFEYVNSRYIFNEENYPVMGRLTDDQKKIFSLNHGLLHILKSVNKINGDVPFEKKGIRKLQWIAQPDEKLGNLALIQKVATLKMIVNILSLANTAGITKEQIAEFKIPTDEEMVSLIPIKQMGVPITPTFTDTIQYLIEGLAVLLEGADHKNSFDEEFANDLIKRVFLATAYWFDDFWVPDFLAQIPNVMKSK
jgi:hypothetical protein